MNQTRKALRRKHFLTWFNYITSIGIDLLKLPVRVSLNTVSEVFLLTFK